MLLNLSNPVADIPRNKFTRSQNLPANQDICEGFHGGE